MRIRGSGGGGKGGGGSSGGQTIRAPVEAPNSLRSKQYARVVDLLCEGPIEGLVDGFKSVFFNGTPWQNADDSFNFPGGTLGMFLGTQSQSYLPGFADVEDETAVDTEVLQATPVVRTITDPDINAVRITISTPQLATQDQATGDLSGSYIEWYVDIQSSGGGYVTVHGDNLTGKTMGRYQRSVEITLTGSAPWDGRVRRASLENPTANIQNRMNWDSYTSITYAKMAYPNSAVVGISVDAALFSAIPVRSYDVRMQRVKIPSNYDPFNRVYIGTWDGTFVVAWTDNPAWCFYDLVTESRYGLGQYISEDQLDKWGLYEIAQYCDELIPDGFGGMEPRLTCNLYIQADSEALEALANLASIFRGMAYWAGGQMMAVQDAPSDPVHLYTNANVIDGLFEREGTSRDARHTTATVMWNDPENQYKLVPEYVEDVAAVSRYGIRETKVTAFGCTSRGQAHRVGKWLLYSERVETQSVRFSVGLEGIYCRPGDVINTMDQHRAGARHGGRVVSANANSITIDASVTIGSGGHSMNVLMPDGTVEERVLTNAPGPTLQFTWAAGLPAVPLAGAIWVLTTPLLSPEWWRVVSVSEADKVRFEITAIEHDPNKYLAVEQDIILAPLQTTIIERAPPAPQGLVLTDTVRRGKGGDIVTYLTATWLPVPPVSGEVRYAVEWRQENGNWASFETWHITTDIEGVRDLALYEVNIYAINGLGYFSLPARASRVVQGKLAAPSSVAGFSVIPGVGNVVIYVDAVQDADLDRIEVRYGDDVVAVWETAEALTNILRGETSTSAAVPTGMWRFFAKAIDTSGNESLDATTFDAEVLQGGPLIIFRKDDAPGFPGTLTNMRRHYAGKIYPLSQGSASAAGWEIFDQHVYNPVTSCSYELVEADKRVDAVSRLYLQSHQANGPGESGAPDPETEIDYRLTAAAYDGFEPWSIGSANFRYAKGKLIWDLTAGNTMYVDSAIIIADELEANIEERSNVPISAAGTVVTFSSGFNLAPNVSLTLVGGAGAVSARLTAKSVTSMTVVVLNTAGSLVAGVVDWSAKGA